MCYDYDEYTKNHKEKSHNTTFNIRNQKNYREGGKGVTGGSASEYDCIAGLSL